MRGSKTRRGPLSNTWKPTGNVEEDGIFSVLLRHISRKRFYSSIVLYHEEVLPSKSSVTQIYFELASIMNNRSSNIRGLTLICLYSWSTV